MSRNPVARAAGLCALVVILAAPGARPQSSLPTRIGKIAVSGTGGWDYLSVDTASHRLYVSHATRVNVVDTKNGTEVGLVENTPGIHGIAVVPEFHRGFTSNGATATVTVFDLSTLEVVRTVSVTGRKPDAIIYDPYSKRVFTFNGASANATAIDPATCAVVGTIALGGAPENAVADERGHIFVNLEDQNCVVEFDAASLTVEARWPLSPGETPTGLSMDRKSRRLFAGCRNQLLVVMDADSGKVVSTVPIGKGVDGTAFDPQTHLIFASNKDGTLNVVRQNSPSDYVALGRVTTAPGAKTMALDASTHRLYLSAGVQGGRNAEADAGLFVLVLSQLP